MLIMQCGEDGAGEAEAGAFGVGEQLDELGER
jgi:hypothetical protein